jgi:gliding motility-associated-like protein
VSGVNTNRLVLTSKNINDSTQFKLALLGVIGNLPKGIKPPNEFKILVKIFQGECEIEAICTIRSIIRVEIGTPTDTLLCDSYAPLNLFTLLKGNDITIGEWTPKLSNGNTFFDPKIDKSGVFQYKVSGSFGCPSDSVKVKIEAIKVPSFSLGKDTSICVDSSRVITVSGNYDKYLWQDQSGNKSYTVTQPGVYFATASIKGCAVTDTLKLAPLNCKKCQFYAPNVISANNNGTNDDFRLYSDCVPTTYLLRVFNRWGDLVFQTTNFEEGWDGNFKGKEQVQGIYVYYVEIQTDYQNKPFYEKKKGDFMLMR